MWWVFVYLFFIFPVALFFALVLCRSAKEGDRMAGIDY
jgi:hypothetical protein